MLQRVILSGGSGSGTSLNLQYTLSYVRIGWYRKNIFW
jgi:hypothetical protein